MTTSPLPTADLIARAVLAAMISLAQDPSSTGLSGRGQSRRSRAAAASAVARLWARPLRGAAKCVGLRPEEVWAARHEALPGFRRAEREAAALLRTCCGLPPQARGRQDEDADVGEDEVVRLKPLSADIVRWASTYVRRGVSVDDLADLFGVAADGLGAAVEAHR